MKVLQITIDEKIIYLDAITFQQIKKQHKTDGDIRRISEYHLDDIQYRQLHFMLMIHQPDLVSPCVSETDLDRVITVLEV